MWCFFYKMSKNNFRKYKFLKILLVCFFWLTCMGRGTEWRQKHQRPTYNCTEVHTELLTRRKCLQIGLPATDIYVTQILSRANRLYSHIWSLWRTVFAAEMNQYHGSVLSYAISSVNKCKFQNIVQSCRIVVTIVKPLLKTRKYSLGTC